ncbi:MAG TPA: BON domain-containing protein [Armatimonadota bacterium]|jgi:hypothetical protein|nr:BON domain-containing protein [Armatimonadota bacterium]HOP80542.1 BON domain-containing protein [Armatimonadota bacterium]HPP76321.1 BON domain-containing protein [Armatimonadota bacterium]
MISQPSGQTMICGCCGQPLPAGTAQTSGQTVVCIPASQLAGMGMGFGMQQGLGMQQGFGALQGLGGGFGGQRWGTRPAISYTGGLPTDSEIEDMVYDSIDMDPLIPYDANIDIKVDAGTVTLSGEVPSKRIKHAAGDDAFWVPGVIDVDNQIKVTGRKRRTQQGQE